METDISKEADKQHAGQYTSGPTDKPSRSVTKTITRVKGNDNDNDTQISPTSVNEGLALQARV